jgi:sortase A
MCLLWCGWVIAQQKSFQSREREELERVSSRSTRAANPAPTLQPTNRVTPAPPARQALIGKLEVPRVKLSAMVVEGDDDETLNMAVGHLPDTPLPGQPGNSALAGHRDTFFRPLKDVRVGDEILLTTAHGSLRYRVERTIIVDPDNLSVLEPTPTSTLTLVTCFPFFYVGHAPRRYIVQAAQVGA